jgi:hypothetical protein
MQETLAKRAGVAVRSVRRCEEGGVHTDAIVRCIAKALGVEPNTFATELSGAVRDRRVSRTARSQLLPPPSASEALVDAERDQGSAHRVDDKGRQILTATVFQDIMTVYRACEGRTVVVEGQIERQRGVPHVEAQSLGSENGAAARFMVVCEIAPGHVLTVTVHAREIAHILALQALHARRGHARIVVRVVVARIKDGMVSVHGLSQSVPAKLGEFTFTGYAKFAANEAHPWTFLVEAVEPMDGAPPAAVRKLRRANTAG